MKLKGEQVKFSRRERLSMGWPRGLELLVGDIPIYLERDSRTFDKIIERIDPTEPLVGTMEGVQLARIENRAFFLAKAQDKFVEQQMPIVEAGIQRLLENQEVKL